MHHARLVDIIREDKAHPFVASVSIDRRVIRTFGLRQMIAEAVTGSFVIRQQHRNWGTGRYTFHARTVSEEDRDRVLEMFDGREGVLRLGIPGGSR